MYLMHVVGSKGGREGKKISHDKKSCTNPYGKIVHEVDGRGFSGRGNKDLRTGGVGSIF